MPTDTTVLAGQLAGPFSVSIAGNPAHAMRFDRGKIYFGDRLLRAEDQKKLLDEYVNVYSVIRRRNYGWRFLSGCHHFFSGRLRDIQQFKTDEEKIRYLFCHAERRPWSKTAEALRKVLSSFNSVFPSEPSSQVRKKTTHFLSDPAYQLALGEYNQHSLEYSGNFSRYLQWVEVACASIWRQPAMLKAASVSFFEPDKSYSVFFADKSRCVSAEHEKIEVIWSRQLYDALIYFRCRVNASGGQVSEVHAAFNDLIVRLHQDPMGSGALYAKTGDFYDAVVMLRLQATVIHMDWIRSLGDAKSMLTL